MTYLVKDIRDQLAASAAIQNAFSDRIFPEVIPQELRDANNNRRSPFPCLVINEISAEPAYSLRGEVGTHTAQIQIDVWTDGTGGKQRAVELGELVRNRLNGYRGTIGTGCYGTIRMIRNDPTFAPPVDGSDLHRRRVSQDYEVIHSADVPTFA